MAPRVKICGITRHEDAELATSLGAWAIGFNFWKGSKRRCDPAVAAGIARALRRRVEPVGVFVNPTLDEVVRLTEGVGLTHVQLHGDEGPSFCTAVAERTGARVIKALRIGSGADIRDAERFHTDFHLLDAAAGAAYGGTGRTWRAIPAATASSAKRGDRGQRMKPSAQAPSSTASSASSARVMPQILTRTRASVATPRPALPAE